MRQVTTEELASPVTALDPEVVEFRAQFGQTSPLDELVRHGAQQMLQSAIEREVDEFLAQHSERRDARGNRQVIRNGRPGRAGGGTRRLADPVAHRPKMGRLYFNIWNEHFGQSAPSGAGTAASAAVPDRASGLPWIVAAGLIALHRRRQ